MSSYYQMLQDAKEGSDNLFDEFGETVARNNDDVLADIPKESDYKTEEYYTRNDDGFQHGGSSSSGDSGSKAAEEQEQSGKASVKKIKLDFSDDYGAEKNQDSDSGPKEPYHSDPESDDIDKPVVSASLTDEIYFESDYDDMEAMKQNAVELEPDEVEYEEPVREQRRIEKDDHEPIPDEDEYIEPVNAYDGYEEPDIADITGTEDITKKLYEISDEKTVFKINTVGFTDDIQQKSFKLENSIINVVSSYFPDAKKVEALPAYFCLMEGCPDYLAHIGKDIIEKAENFFLEKRLPDRVGRTNDKTDTTLPVFSHFDSDGLYDGRMVTTRVYSIIEEVANQYFPSLTKPEAISAYVYLMEDCPEYLSGMSDKIKNAVNSFNDKYSINANRIDKKGRAAQKLKQEKEIKQSEKKPESNKQGVPVQSDIALKDEIRRLNEKIDALTLAVAYLVGKSENLINDEITSSSDILFNSDEASEILKKLHLDTKERFKEDMQAKGREAWLNKNKR